MVISNGQLNNVIDFLLAPFVGDCSRFYLDSSFLQKTIMFIDELSNKIWKTESARFVAYRRMKSCKISSNAVLALLPAQIIAINLLVYTDFAHSYTNRITIVTIVLSLFLLVLSLLVSLLRYEYRENNYHACGIELGRLNLELQYQKNNPNELSFSEMKQYLTRYNDILIKYNLNHTSFDYYWGCKEVLDKKELSRFNRIFLYFYAYIFNMATFYWLLLLFVPFISFCIIFNNMKFCDVWQHIF